ncbi:hypothetical protein M2375_003683 [Comamonas sp. BIGb0152]|uniref:fibronectin type III domain-containing protein n=1 Tax=Comamonas sp. BIGb0152 TaxID=2940601 RepID=UPI00216975DC|nr:fibronectin type III domain-containing protein [Comamonas sp. BIGb0152]MCS4295440.1 hypothetical protein [Comamonas sp. BIGb0152]
MASAQSIDTVPDWDGIRFINSFGVPNTATYGQTITAPATPATLRAFDVRINPQGIAVPFKFYVYEWDSVNKRATSGQLYASAVQTMQAVDEFQTYGVSGLNISLEPGKQYVLFASVSETSGPNSNTFWASVADGSYAGGRFVYLNNGPDVSSWITANWNEISSDLAFTADIEFQGLPVAPNLTIASVGDGQASFGLSLSDSGSAPLQQYSISCEPQGDAVGASASGASSPLAVTGLTNGTAYDCTATATNTDGLTGPESSVVTVTPKAAPVAPKPVPTLSQWSTLLVSGVLAAMAMLGMARAGRRRG